MPRFARVVIPDVAHHVTQRGNNRQAVFFVDDDYRVYLDLRAEHAEAYSLRIDGYCLMPNHVHLVATPAASQSLAKAVGRTNFRYTQYVNRMHSRSGHLWQNRFYSCPLDAKHFRRAMIYVERNPVRARLCRRPWRYPWSSAAAHVGLPISQGHAAAGIPDLTNWREPPDQWRDALTNGDEQMAELIRTRTQTGRPLGGDSFMSKLEAIIGKRLRPLPIGRPKKDNK